MARTISEIQAGIVTAKTADATLSGLSSTSNTAIWLLWTWVVAAAQWSLENLFDAHVAEVAGIIADQKPHSLQWYVTKAKAFQFGYSLPPDSDVYDTIAPPGDPSFIVNLAAAVELTNLVRIKVAQDEGGFLGQLSSGGQAAFTSYMELIKDAGVRLQITTGNPDTFQPRLTIYYDPLVMDNTGARLDGTASSPVKDAINSFLTSLPFNGVFILNNFIAAMQAVPGVIIADEINVQAFYGAVPPVVITTQYVPDAGYMKLDTTYFNANVNYAPYSI